MWKIQSEKTTDDDKQRTPYSDGECMIDPRTMCSKGRSIREYKSLYNALLQI